jgi:hypothetical protein
MSLDPDARRRLAAKRANERVKLFYSTMNAFAVGVVGITSIFELQRWIWPIAAAGLHLMAQLVIGLLRSEE